MVVYKVFFKNYELKKGELMGMLIERRRDLRGMNPVESGLRWAKLTFGRMAKGQKTIFVIPDELKFSGDTGWLMEKGMFTKEESRDIAKLTGMGG